MEETNQNQNKTRTQRIEEFLLNPDKVVFESIEQMEKSVNELLDYLSQFDVAKLEMLKGEDGVTPKIGVDYFTPEDIAGIEAYILSKIPKVGEDLPSVEQVQNYIAAQVAKIQRVKGDPGEPGKPGKPGKDGSPDSAEDIIKKLRSLGKNQKLQISDIRGLENALRSFTETSDEFEELKKAFEERMVIIPASNPGGGGGSGTDANAIHTNAANEFATIAAEDAPASGDYFLAERASDGAKIKVAFSDIIPDGAGTGDMLSTMYDPTGVEGDVFDMENMEEGANKKILTVAERAKLAFITITGAVSLDALKTKTDFITVTQAVNLDTIESDVAASKTKTDHITVTQAVNLDTIESDVAASKTKTDHISVSQAVNLDTIESDVAAAKTKTDYITITQAVDLDAIETRVNALDAAVVLMGGWDASAGTFPGAGAAQAGATYIVTVAGTVNGVDFAINDRILAIVDNASTATFASNWLKLDYTDQVLSVAGLTGAIAASNLRTALSLVIGTDVQAYNANLTTWGGKTAPAGTVVGTTDTQTLTNKRINKRVVTLTDAATIAVNADTTDIGIVTLGGNRTLGAPTGTPVDGQLLEIRPRQDATGSRTLAYDPIYRFGTDVTSPVLTTTANKTDYELFQYNATDTKWDCIAVAKGY